MTDIDLFKITIEDLKCHLLIINFKVDSIPPLTEMHF